MTKWYMTDGEIQALYRGAKHKTEQIRILAQLNLVKQPEMAEKLRESGFNDVKISAYAKHKAEWSESEVDRMCELRRQGLSFDKISVVLQKTPSACHWYYYHGAKMRGKR